MTDERDMALGGVRPIDGSGETRAYGMPCDHLLTHGVVVGMTGSGKTGLLMVLVEEALRSSVPVIMVDIKGDLPNLLLTFPNLAPEEFRPWVESDKRGKSNGAHSGDDAAEKDAEAWQRKLADWRLGAADVAGFGNDTDCSKSCGDGVVSPPETCDGNCPTSASDCDDGDPCTEDKLIGSASKCNAKCSSEMVSNACASVASGWTLGVLVNGSCPAGFSNPQSLKAGLSVDCSDSCGCSGAAHGTCVGTATVAMTPSPNSAVTCPSTQSFQVDEVSPPSTMPITCNGTVTSVSATPMTWKCGAMDSCPGCTPSGTSQPSVSWASQRSFCTAASQLQCKNGDVCVDSSVSNRLCVMIEGARTCPSGFPTAQGTFYTGMSGTPVCTCGGCGSTSGTCEQTEYHFRQDYTDLATMPSSGGSQAITGVTLEFRATITGSATAATCKDPRASQTGSVTGSGAVTVCCAQ